MKIIDINGNHREAQEVFPDPDYPGYMKVVFKNHHEWYTVQEFLQFNPKLKKLTKKAKPPPADLVGSPTSIGKKYLKDTTQQFQENLYLGCFLWISRGKGEGQMRTIIKNDHNTLHIDHEWDEKPTKLSQYVITANEQSVRPMGNTMPEEDMKKFEKMAFDMDLKRGKVNKHITIDADQLRG